MIAKEHLHKELVKDESPDFHEPFFHNSAMDFAKSLERPPFVTEKDGANERRFELDDTYDKSQYLSTVNRLKQIVPFKTVTSRDQNLIVKGGDKNKALGGKSNVFYNTFKKTGNMERLEKGIPDMNRTTQRGNFQSIYRKESAPNYYDSVKVAEVHKELITNKKNSMVDMKK